MDVSVASFHEANKQQPPDFFWVWVFEQLANPDNDGKPLPSRNGERSRGPYVYIPRHREKYHDDV